MRNTAIIGVAIIVLAMLGAAGVGYALYMGNTYSEDNTMDVVNDSIDIYMNGEPIDTPIAMPAFERNVHVDIEGYTVATTGPGSFYLICNMPSACWPLIDSMTLELNDSNEPYEFGKIVDGMTVSVGVPTPWIEMSDSLTFTSGDDTLLYYDFTIHIEFSDIDPTIDPSYESLVNFEGAEFTFVFEPSSS